MKILIVDDDKIFSKVLKDGITAKGEGKYEVVLARDGEEGIEKVKKEHPGLILLDLVMPGMDGIQFLRKLRTIPELSDIPVFINSQMSDIKKISEGLELGVKGYIVKTDYSIDDIVRRIDDVLLDEKE